ncbi:carboxymuconolactone decarboxylase family protein [Limibacter armeniacum]|uniref:carboxymuconolactone decarboxylase family protein n=1 Tax=Limibacter armeniacum TaxID=466084 RepID=UPI002FE5FB1E
MNKIEEFRSFRSEMNEKILATDNKVVKRIFSLDSLAFKEGALDVKTKEMIGLTISLSLRCDDCVKYHLEKCKEVGFTNEQIIEGMSIANLIGGTIVIPHLRRAVAYLEELDSETL